MLVAITGASGFIGRHTVAGFSAQGHQVRALVRQPSGAWPSGVDERLISGGLDNRGALARALRGVDAVVHLAGRVHITQESAADPATEFHRANVIGTENCLDAAIAGGARNFLLLSSVAAVASPDAGHVTTSSPARPVSDYGRSKLLAESVVRDRAVATGLHAPILRPPMVYGPGMKGNPLRLFELIARGLPLPLGSVRNRRSMLYVGNLVNAMQLALAASATSGESLFVTDGEELATPVLVRRAARALQCPARLIALPVFLLRALGGVGDALAHIAPIQFNSSILSSLIGDLVLDDSRLAALAGYAPVFTVDEGLDRTAEWFLASRKDLR